MVDRPELPPNPVAGRDRHRALLVTDDPQLRIRAASTLAAAGFDLDVAGLCGDGSAPLRPGGQVVAVVDLTQRPERALSAIERLRMDAPRLPVLALVAADSGATTRDAAHAGADDFCLREAGAWEIQARLERLIDRFDEAPATRSITVGDLELDLQTRSARRAGVRLALSSRQFELLELLMRHAGETLSRDRIEAALQLPPRDRGSNVVEVHVHHLRRRIGPGRLSTLRGRGYVLHAAARDGN